jgi:multisubunit Na+/H+ antiporter MnhG subunit
MTQREVSLHEVLVALLLFVSAPVSAYLVARVALQRRSNARDGVDGEDR